MSRYFITVYLSTLLVETPVRTVQVLYAIGQAMSTLLSMPGGK